MKKTIIARSALAFYLVVIGVAFLTENFGNQKELVNQALRLWPILPIALGLDFLVISLSSRKAGDAERMEGPEAVVIGLVIFISILGLTVFPLLRSFGGRGFMGGIFRENWRFGDWFTKDYITVSRDIDRRFESVGGLKALRVKSDFGNITVKSNTMLENEIKVSAEIRARGKSKKEASDYASSVDIEADIDGGEIGLTVSKPESIRSSGIPFASIDLVIEVPREIELVVNNTFGNISIDDIEGDLDIENSSGNITLEKIGGNTLAELKFGKLTAREIVGNLEFEASSGSVSIEHITGDVKGKAAFGSVNIAHIGGDARIRVESGSLRIDLIEGDAELDCRFGNITVGDALGSVKASNNAGGIDISSSDVGGEFDINTKMGSIRLTIPEGSAITLDASARMGRIDSNLPITTTGPYDRNNLRGDINGGGHLFKLNAEAGNITIKER